MDCDLETVGLASSLFKLQTSGAEIYQQADIQAICFQIINCLSKVDVFKLFHGLELHHYLRVLNYDSK